MRSSPGSDADGVDIVSAMASFVKNLFYKPVQIAAGMLAGMIGRRIYEALWGAIDGGPVPAAQDRRAGLRRLALSLGLQGAVFALVRGLADNAARRGFQAFTGAWPGKDQAETKAE